MKATRSRTLASATSPVYARGEDPTSRTTARLGLALVIASACSSPADAPAPAKKASPKTEPEPAPVPAAVASADMRIAGCTAAACRVAERCGIRFEAGPRTVLCKARLGLDDLPADFDLTPYCVEGCRAMGGGEIAACLEAKAECVAGDVIAPEDFGCAGSTEAPEREPECAETCDGAKKECDYACPITSLRACMDCSAGCGAAWHACLQRC